MTKKHILVVDDETAIRALLTEVLQLAGYRVSAAASAAEGMAVVRRNQPDLIIADLQMEETDGFDFIDELQTVVPGLPVVLLTGVLFDEEVIRTKLEGKIVGYLDKTVPLERIIAEVRRHLAD